MAIPNALPNFSPTAKSSTQVLVSQYRLLPRLAPKMITKISKGHILVIDVDPENQGVIQTLEAHGYEVDEATSVEIALEQCKTTKYDLILIEVNPTGFSLLRTCKKLRGITNAPVVVQAVSDASEDKIEALDAGADAYVTKTIAAGELLARIRATLRRATLPVRGIAPLKLGDVEINFETRRVTVGQKNIHLTPKEFALLQYLISHPNQMIPHLELLREVWGVDHVNGRQHLRVFINRLRKKIEASPRNPKFLLTDLFFGYRLQTLE